MLFYVAWQMSRRRGDIVPAETGLMPSSYYDPAEGRQVSYGVHGLGLGFGLSFVAGNVSGLLGVGGGAFKVPIMNLLMGVPLKATIATSNLMIGVTAATGAAIFYGRGYMDPHWAVPGRARHPRRRAARPAPGHPPAVAGPRHRLRGRARRLRRAHAAQGAGGGRVSGERPGGGADGRRAVPQGPPAPHVMEPIERMVSRVLTAGIAVASR